MAKNWRSQWVQKSWGGGGEKNKIKKGGVFITLSPSPYNQAVQRKIFPAFIGARASRNMNMVVTETESHDGSAYPCC